MPTSLFRPYCSLADVQKECRNSKDINNDWFALCINRASRWIEEHCQRDFWLHDHASSPLRVPRQSVMSDEVHLLWPVLTLTKVAVVAQGNTAPTAADELASTDYYFEVGSRIITCDGGVFGPYPFKGVMELTGTFGYEVTTEEVPPTNIPQGINRACSLIAAAWSSEKRIEQIGLDGAKIELLETTVPKEARLLLQRWVSCFRSQF